MMQRSQSFKILKFQMSQPREDEENMENNNTGHIVVHNSENNNVGDVLTHNGAGDGLQDDAEDEEDNWLSEGTDEDENYTDEEGDMDLPDPASLLRTPVPDADLPSTVTVLENNGCRLYLV